MRVIASWIFASAICLLLISTTGCGDSARTRRPEAENAPAIPVVNDPEFAWSSEDRSALGKRFVVTPIHTNNWSGIGIVDVEANEPIWIEWNLEHLGLGRKISYCFEGKPVMELYFRTNRPFRRDVIYYGADGHRTLLLTDRTDSGMFTDRVFYENGTHRWQVWHEEAWRPSEEPIELEITTPSDSLLKCLSNVPLMRDVQGRATSAELSELAKRFQVAQLRTNDVDGVAIVDTQAKKPIWVEWNFERVGLSHDITYCFGGQPVLDVYIRTNGPAGRDVCYYDARGFGTVLLMDRSGVGTFTDRILYEKGAGLLEVWYNEVWHRVEERKGRRGIVLGGQWRPLAISNDLWITTSP